MLVSAKNFGGYLKSFIGIFCLSCIGFGVASAPSPLAKFGFTDQRSKPYLMEKAKEQYLFISFVYTRCPMPKMCPLTMQLNKQLYRAWKKEQPEVPLHFLIVTLDPENDSPAELNKYGNKFNLDPKAFSLVTGEPKVLSDFAAEFNTLAFPTEGMISHNVKSALLGPGFTPIQEYKENEWTPKQVLRDLKTFRSGPGQKKTP